MDSCHQKINLRYWSEISEPVDSIFLLLKGKKYLSTGLSTVLIRGEVWSQSSSLSQDEKRRISHLGAT